ncbi:mitoferrin-1-like [Diorhabda sublineata]|uniref:mitoferrin-1-like n=1 Tax=Diorhabda sublineata TaxID=1163346 RepID=UPI0024E17597|nr:mitoferrin-1-like [Diorhabda sublineata]
MIRQEGPLSPIRGMSAIAIAAGPAHGLYFANYELVKDKLKHFVKNDQYDSICHGIAGCTATFFHDSIMNPSEVVKQRMQMQNSVCRNTFKCAVDIYKNEGVRAFYRSFFTTLIMNIPFQSIHFMIYEICQNILNKERAYNPGTHVLSGGIAGGVASAVTNPLDVCKTLLNTQEGTKNVESLKQAAGIVFKTKGPLGFLGGLQARMLYTIPSTAICWFTYEFFKFFLQNKTHIEPKRKE